MPYIGRSTDGFGVRNRFLYLASANDTSVSGADANGATLTFTDGAYVDVYLNGVLLKPTTDYNTSTANTIAGLSALNTNDEVTVVVYDVFTVGDMVSATSGGTFVGAVTFDSTLDMNGTELILDADGDTSITADTDDSIDFKTSGTDRVNIDNAGHVQVKTGGLTINTVGQALGVGTNNPGHAIEVKHTAPEIMLEETSSGGSKRLSLGVTSGGQPFINAEQSGGSIAMNMTGTEVAKFNSNGLSFPNGKGIDFSATGDGTGANQAEVLDDYEEGTWTPTLPSGGTISTIHAAVYTKIGNLVRVGIYIAMSSIPNNSSAFYVGGLPFQVAYTSGGGNDHYHANGAITYVGSHNINSFGMLPPTPWTGQSSFYFHRGDGSSSTVLNSNMTGCPYLIMATTYITNA